MTTARNTISSKRSKKLKYEAISEKDSLEKLIPILLSTSEKSKGNPDAD
jgi:hypothetical protein